VELLVVGVTASIGFTVALFFATAAFPAGMALAETKLGALFSFTAAPLAIAVARMVQTSSRRPPLDAASTARRNGAETATPLIGRETMARYSRQIDDRITALAWALIDLRAHFEAQLRAVGRAEEAVGKCRAVRNVATFESATTALRAEIQIVSDNNRSVRAVIDQMNLDSRDLAGHHTK
jgi:hypothetical protein